jgi:hypothetical protein
MKKKFFLSLILTIDIFYMFLAFFIHIFNCKNLKDIIISIVALFTAYEFPLHIFCGINPRNGRKYVLFNNTKLHHNIYFVGGIVSIFVGSYLFWYKNNTAASYLIIYGGTLIMCFILEYGKIKIPSIWNFSKKVNKSSDVHIKKDRLN